jgi:hypothetical protein
MIDACDDLHPSTRLKASEYAFYLWHAKQHDLPPRSDVKRGQKVGASSAHCAPPASPRPVLSQGSHANQIDCSVARLVNVLLQIWLITDFPH